MQHKGFTLAELLIALAILGVIATFTIPKVLNSQQNGQYNAIGKECMGMVAGAFEEFKRENTVLSTTTATNLTPYMNYVSHVTTGAFDGAGAVNDCGQTGGTRHCLKLHNGGVMQYQTTTRFNGTNNNNFIWFACDPDASVETTDNALVIFLYFNGRLSTWHECAPGSTNNNWAVAPCPDPSASPSWFSWN